MKAKLLFLVLVVAAGTVFAQNKAIQGASVSKYEATQLKNNGNMFIVPVVASLDIANKTPTDYKLKETISLPEMKKKESEKEYFSRVEKYINLKIDELKAQALFEFIDKENCSLIVSPIYSIKTLSSQGTEMTIEVRIKGYPATYTKFRDMQTADSTIVKLNRLIVDKKDELHIMTDRQVETNERTEEVKRN
jgi:predicted adenine nucleotide alpha hydrolase (AANH) superfamily ATPase